MNPLAFALLLVLSQNSVAPGETWPQWRGPTADSISPSKNLPTSWSDKENIAWKTRIPGWGTSTPAIWKDAIFVTTQVDESKLFLLRLDARSGKIVWEREIGKGEPRRKGPVGVGRFHDEHNMASPSPITDGKYVWAHFGNGDLACYDFEGEKIWSKNMVDEQGVYSIWWGHANSPVLFKDLLISVCIQDTKGGGKNYVVAHDKLTGKLKWRTSREYDVKGEPADSYTTPLLFDNKGKTEVVVFGANVLDGYDPDTGKRLWMCKPFAGNRVISGPTLIGDTVYAIQGMKGPVFAIKAGGIDDTTASNVKWKVGGGTTPDAASPVVTNGLVFLANNTGMVTCLEADTGKEIWKERLSDGFRATPLVVGDRVYLFGRDGKTSIVAAGRTFKLIGTSELGEQITASPAVANDSLFIRTKEHLYRIANSR